MKVEFKEYGPDQSLDGKIVLRPESLEEQETMDRFRKRVGNRQTGRKFDIVFPKRKVGPAEIAEVLKRLPVEEKVGG